MTTVPPPLVVLNFVPIVANRILALFDLQVTAWRVTLRRCLWRQEGTRQWVELPCRAIDFWNHRDERIFQQMALDVLCQAAEQLIGSARTKPQNSDPTDPSTSME
jgi:hypothetical protein